LIFEKQKKKKALFKFKKTSARNFFALKKKEKAIFGPICSYVFLCCSYVKNYIGTRLFFISKIPFVPIVPMYSYLIRVKIKRKKRTVKVN